ncbi:hypothetical protein L596_020914 [Steinernema carpocapsae]|uniref:Uncharacterized protein n=1 Tax=Steinernema carpocapsae TaxID=34508 RepID=A0A4U5MUZ0_STECR|nr:hypothetical protein L596_020914 [Steinernema carpocapsae]
MRFLTGFFLCALFLAVFGEEALVQNPKGAVNPQINGYYHGAGHTGGPHMWSGQPGHWKEDEKTSEEVNPLAINAGSG